MNVILRDMAAANPTDTIPTDTIAGLTAVNILAALVEATQVTPVWEGSLGCPYCGACMESREPHNHSCPYAQAVLFLDATHVITGSIEIENRPTRQQREGFVNAINVWDVEEAV